MKGSKPAGNTTTTTINPTQQAQLPFLQDLWGQTQGLGQTNPMQYYPNATLSQWGTPEKTTGYQNMYNNAYNTNANLPIVNAAYNTAVTGGYGAGINPANPYYQDYASGGGPSQQMQQGLYGQGLSQGGQYAQQIGQYAVPMQQQGANTANVGGQYAQQIGQYAVPMQQQGANAASVGGQYAQQIGQYADPLMQYARQAGANNNLGLSQLGNTASGTYLDPNTNPYMAQMVQAAMDPVTRNYQTSIAPQTDAMFSGGGRYGSGAMAGAVDTGQRNLVRGLSDLSGNLYGQQFARERQAQDAAAQNYGQLYNTGLGLGMQGAQNAANIQQQAGQQFLSSQDRALAGLRDAAAAQTGAGSQYLSSQAQAAAGLRDAANIQNAAGNQYFQGQTAAQNAANQFAQGGQFGAGGLNSMFNTGNQAAMNALLMYPQLAGAQNIGAQQQVAAGTGLAGVDQARIADEMARFYGQQKAPWDTLNTQSALYGNPTGGSSAVSQPYFQNQGANLLSGLTGAASLGNQFGLFGGGAAAAAPGWAAGTGAGSGIFTNLATGATSDIAGVAMPAIAGASGGGGLFSGLGSLLGGIFASDRRLKEGDAVVGHIGELPIHTFRYKGDDKERIGFMADEVAKIDPGAVVDTDTGYKAVNYDRAFTSALNSFRKRA